jgi:hypothetical protein
MKPGIDKRELVNNQYTCQPGQRGGTRRWAIAIEIDAELPCTRRVFERDAARGRLSIPIPIPIPIAIAIAIATTGQPNVSVRGYQLF